MYIHGAPQEPPAPYTPNPEPTIQPIELTFTHDRYTNQAIKNKQDKYNPLIDAIKAQKWQANPLIVSIARVRSSVQTKKYYITRKRIHTLQTLILRNL
jgi:hypothetical protein